MSLHLIGHRKYALPSPHAQRANPNLSTHSQHHPLLLSFGNNHTFNKTLCSHKLVFTSGKQMQCVKVVLLCMLQKEEGERDKGWLVGGVSGKGKLFIPLLHHHLPLPHRRRRHSPVHTLPFSQPIPSRPIQSPLWVPF